MLICFKHFFFNRINWVFLIVPTTYFSNNKFLLASWFVQKTILLLFTSILGKSIQGASVKSQDLEIKVNSNNLYPILYFLQKHTICQFKVLVDFTCYDAPDKTCRFCLVYNLLSSRYNTRIRVVSKLKSTLALLSIFSLYLGAGWMEREILDMFGVYFFLNKDLRRILTDYGLNGHPLRRDFPLTGYLEVYYDDNQNQISYKLVELAQGYRAFNFRLV
jgi:NADH:ubiquinone oxidoreductase subunit C